MTDHPAWYYNDIQQAGTDFEDMTQVATYDRNQTSSSVEEEQQLVTQLGISTGQTVIDFGCGTGTFAIQAASQVPMFMQLMFLIQCSPSLDKKHNWQTF
ncbi:hypothetical protein [Leptolyngbya sp. FACHB-671]|uniref:hypothetical protein n=1 Tax=Leptolyngbya sp. FACHB-671 TaxID=2692812 RepID=UPI0018EF5B4A|nr:hypothetical protein [Leptolyngbya sp. FACHB-671]